MTTATGSPTYLTFFTARGKMLIGFHGWAMFTIGLKAKEDAISNPEKRRICESAD
jgi:hypothetical protein